MNDQWAAENLQTIRTLMERSAVYRRALAPVMTVTGVIGMGAALAGWKADLAGRSIFVLYWLCVAAVAVIAGLALIRRQALQQHEPLWSPPTRRVSQAMLPALFAGLAIGLIVAGTAHGAGEDTAPDYYSHVGLPLLWVVLYGCAVHAAGFFMKRGIRVFGWTIILCGCLGFLMGRPSTPVGLANLGYGIMGVVFGVFHAAFGIYLFVTETRTRTQ